jgi:cytochrome b561
VANLRYTRVAIALHWLMAALIVSGWTLGLSMVDLPFSPTRLKWYSWHKWIGVTVFGLAALRLCWRLLKAPPPLPASVPPWQHTVSKATHVVLYVLMLVTPVIGWLFSSAAGMPTVYLGLWRLPDLVVKDEALAGVLQNTHAALAYLLAALIVLHIAAALKHHFIDRDTVLARMFPFIRTKGYSRDLS